jgi:hypothetical protein
LNKNNVALALVAIVLTVVMFFVQSMIFPPMGMPPMSWLPEFLFLGIWDALAFGIGVALLIYLAMNYSKWPKQIRGSLLILSFIAAWFTVLTWIHDGLHNSGAMPPNWGLLAFTEYMFHVPWLIFGLAVAFVIRQLAGAFKK